MGRVPLPGGGGPEGPPPKLAPPSPSVVVDARPVGRADRLTVGLRRWPVGAVTVTVCGGAVRRGSADCDLRGSQGAAVGPAGSATAIMALTPPTPCPCVVMVWSPTHALLQTAPIHPARSRAKAPKLDHS